MGDITGEMIRAKRKELGMTQKELASKINVSQTHLNKIELDRSSACMEVKIKLLDALGFTNSEDLLLESLKERLVVLYKEVEFIESQLKELKKNKETEV